MTNDIDELTRLVELVKEFERLDALIASGIESGNLEIIDQTLEAKKEINRDSTHLGKKYAFNMHNK